VQFVVELIGLPAGRPATLVFIRVSLLIVYEERRHVAALQSAAREILTRQRLTSNLRFLSHP
jgi:hypothetical protein